MKMKFLLAVILFWNSFISCTMKAQDLKANYAGQLCIGNVAGLPQQCLTQSSSTPEQGVYVMLMQRQIELLERIDAGVNLTNNHIDVNTKAMADASAAIISINKDFNAKVITLIQNKFDQLPAEIQTTDVYKKLKEDLLKDVQVLIDKGSTNAAAPLALRTSNIKLSKKALKQTVKVSATPIKSQ